MRKCRNKAEYVTGAAVCFSLGVLLSFFLPHFILIIIEALLILLVAITFFLYLIR